MLYKQTSVGSNARCSDIGLCEACSGGLFQGDPSYKYGVCSTLGSACTATAVTGSVASGAGQTFYDNNANCAKLDLTCLNGGWYDANGASFTAATVNAYSLTCTATKDCKTLGGITIPNGGSSYVFTNSAVDAGMSCYSTGNVAMLNCSNRIISPTDPGPTFKYASCDIKKCNDPTDATGVRKISAGVTANFFSQSAANCAASDPSNDCAAHKVSIACGTSGGTPTVTPATTDFSPYRFTSCTIPTSCSQCAISTLDSGNVLVNVNASTPLYKAATADYCSSIAADFTCTAGTGSNPPSLVGANGAVIANYRYYNCKGAGDQGDGGGSGGGTGNDDGPGSAIRKRFGAGDSDGGPSLGCIDATLCPGTLSNASPPDKLHFVPCLMPWGTGEIEFYGAFNAFSKTGVTLASGTNDTVCVKPPDTCSKPPHASVRATSRLSRGRVTLCIRTASRKRFAHEFNQTHFIKLFISHCDDIVGWLPRSR